MYLSEQWALMLTDLKWESFIQANPYVGHLLSSHPGSRIHKYQRAMKAAFKLCVCLTPCQVSEPPPPILHCKPVWPYRFMLL